MKKMLDELLKPCPFCGGKAALFVDEGVKVVCVKCHASTQELRDMFTTSGVAGNATEAVIEDWNKRVDGEAKDE